MNLRTVIPVWIAAVIGAIVIGVFAPTDYLQWLPIALAITVIGTFCLQIAIVQKEGLVDRVMASLGGSIVILGVATAILALLA